MKAILKKLFGNPGPKAGRDDALLFIVKCDHCGDQITVRADRTNDLLPDYEDDEGGFTLSKEIQDGTCFRVMKLTARFSRDKRLVAQEVTGGKLIETKE